DMILAHANGSIESDGCGAEAIGALCPEIPVSSVKPMLGETVGAGGGFQVLAGLAVMQNGLVPPILNVQEMNGWPGVRIVTGSPVAKAISAVLVNTIDPGGNVISIVLRTLD
ncbi:MAG: hypothetical protein K9N51_07480, partial [Candidatus Pacebacteria bacterium]|nr:hypothetical protein [Candidatus Paceibacterota bacterium]